MCFFPWSRRAMKSETRTPWWPAWALCGRPRGSVSPQFIILSLPVGPYTIKFIILSLPAGFLHHLGVLFFWISSTTKCLLQSSHSIYYGLYISIRGVSWVRLFSNIQYNPEQRQALRASSVLCSPWSPGIHNLPCWFVQRLTLFRNS